MLSRQIGSKKLALSPFSGFFSFVSDLLVAVLRIFANFCFLWHYLTYEAENGVVNSKLTLHLSPRLYYYVFVKSKSKHHIE